MSKTNLNCNVFVDFKPFFKIGSSIHTKEYMLITNCKVNENGFYV